MDRIIFRKPPILKPRVALGLLTPEDLPEMTRELNNPELTQFLDHFRYPVTQEKERLWLENLNPANDLVFGIVRLSDGALLGTMGLHLISLLNRHAVTGAFVFAESARGQGYGREAKMTLLRYAFIELGLLTIRSEVYSFNERSRRYNEACGYKVVGTLKDWIRRQDTAERTDVLIMQVTVEDWLPLYEKWKQT